MYDGLHNCGLHIMADQNNSVRIKLRECFNKHTSQFIQTNEECKRLNPVGLFLQSSCDDYMYIEFLCCNRDDEDQALNFAEQLCQEINERLYI